MAKRYPAACLVSVDAVSHSEMDLVKISSGVVDQNFGVARTKPRGDGVWHVV